MTDNTLKPIETRYAGRKFRSRLEARWGVFFDTLGLDWVYEPEGYDLGEAGWYLPDFWLPLPTTKHHDAGYFIEIKGVKPLDSYLDKLRTLSVESRHGVWCFVGEPGKQLQFIAHHSGSNGWRSFGDAAIGVNPFVFDLWCTFARFWTCGTTSPKTRLTPTTIENAISAALSARFEHGEGGTK